MIRVDDTNVLVRVRLTRTIKYDGAAIAGGSDFHVPLSDALVLISRGAAEPADTGRIDLGSVGDEDTLTLRSRA